MIQFFAPDIETTLTLPESDSQHCIRVLRMNVGDLIQVTDGRGHRYVCRLVDTHSKHTAVEIVEREDVAKVWPNRIVVGVAPTKHMDRMEWMVEKLTEIGVDEIVMLKCDRSERKEIKPERLQKIAVSAMKQSLKATLPVVTEMLPLDMVLREADCGNKYIAYCDKTIPRKLFAHEYVAHKDTFIIIGPEGDFSPREITTALECGWKPISLGDNRLRTETAAIVACDTCQILNQLANE